MPVVSVSMPADLIERLDAHAAAHDYTGRSEVVRESARELLTEFADDRFADGRHTGVVTVCYDYDTQHVERRLAELRRGHDADVVATDHTHVADSCVDLFVLEAELDAVSGFVGSLRAIEDVETVDYSLVPLDALGHRKND